MINSPSFFLHDSSLLFSSLFNCTAAEKVEKEQFHALALFDLFLALFAISCMICVKFDQIKKKLNVFSLFSFLFFLPALIRPTSRPWRPRPNPPFLMMRTKSKKSRKLKKSKKSKSKKRRTSSWMKVTMTPPWRRPRLPRGSTELCPQSKAGGGSLVHHRTPSPQQ